MRPLFALLVLLGLAVGIAGCKKKVGDKC